MKRLFYILAVLAVISCGSGRKAVQLSEPVRSFEDDPEFVSQTTLIIMYDEGIGKEPLLKAIKEYGAEIKYDYNFIPGIAIKIPEGGDIKDAIGYFKQVKGVVSVNRDHIYHLTDPVPPKTEIM